MNTMSKAAAKTAGLAHRAAKSLEGYPGIFHHLAAEHAEVSSLLGRVTGADHNTRERLFPEIRRQLLAHAHGEENEFYPELRRFPALTDTVETCLREHREIDAMLHELDHSEKSTAAWGNLFNRMLNAIETHVNREEQELFPKAKDLLTRERAEAMEARYESAQKSAPDRA